MPLMFALSGTKYDLYVTSQVQHIDWHRVFPGNWTIFIFLWKIVLTNDTYLIHNTCKMWSWDFWFTVWRNSTLIYRRSTVEMNSVRLQLQRRQKLLCTQIWCGIWGIIDTQKTPGCTTSTLILWVSYQLDYIRLMDPMMWRKWWVRMKSRWLRFVICT